jgi:hypothetical protein
MTATGKLFDMVALMQEKHPFPPKVGADNAKELEFPMRGSTYTCATAGQKAGGRGGGVSFFHGSEVAWWTNAADHFSASVQAVDEVRGRWGVIWERPKRPMPFEERAPEKIEGWIVAPSEIWLETTSAGPTGEFYQRYTDAQKKIGRYRAVFVPWTAQTEYTEAGDFVPEREPEEEGELSEEEYQKLHGLTDGQMLWRKNKIIELGSVGKFRQEYPIDVTEAFSYADVAGIYIKPNIVLRARKRVYDEIPDAPLIIGVDPASGGGDRFAVVWRRGDVCFKYETRNKVEHEEAVNWIAGIIDEWNPSKVCIDRGNIGANIISSLRARSPKYSAVIKGVDFGATSKAKQANPKRSGPWNVRAEIYMRLRTWLIEGGIIPDEDELASDISAAKTKHRANNDWLLESKSDMKARQIRSPDLADALALTFAVTEFFETWSKPKQPQGWNAGHDEMIGHNGGPPLEPEDQGWGQGGATGWMM